MRVLVFGARGWVGGIVARAIPDALFPAAIARIDIRSDVQEALWSRQPDVAINCAGRVGVPNVDWCEDHPFETWRDNAIGPAILAEECAKRRIHLVHVGSGCVFAGQSTHADGAWQEGDAPNATSLYARSKAAADSLLAALPGVAVVRIRMPVSAEAHPRSLPDKLSGYRTVCHAVNSVTFLSEFPRVLLRIAEERATGIFHAVARGVLAHREIVEAWRRLVDRNAPIPEWVADESDLRSLGLARAPRSRAILADTRLAGIGAAMGDAHEMLEKTLKARQK